jgi:hypothetical protein
MSCKHNELGAQTGRPVLFGRTDFWGSIRRFEGAASPRPLAALYTRAPFREEVRQAGQNYFSE